MPAIPDAGGLTTMDENLSADVRNLLDQLDAAERDAHALVAGLREEQAIRGPDAGSWSVAECLDHLATANRVYPRARASRHLGA
jgi:hypothetical protein